MGPAWDPPPLKKKQNSEWINSRGQIARATVSENNTKTGHKETRYEEEN
jgi:hypothetical protein